MKKLFRVQKGIGLIGTQDFESNGGILHGLTSNKYIYNSEISGLPKEAAKIANISICAEKNDWRKRHLSTLICTREAGEDIELYEVITCRLHFRGLWDYCEKANKDSGGIVSQERVRGNQSYLFTKYNIPLPEFVKRLDEIEIMW